MSRKKFVKLRKQSRTKSRPYVLSPGLHSTGMFKSEATLRKLDNLYYVVFESPLSLCKSKGTAVHNLDLHLHIICR